MTCGILPRRRLNRRQRPLKHQKVVPITKTEAHKAISSSCSGIDRQCQLERGGTVNHSNTVASQTIMPVFDWFIVYTLTGFDGEFLARIRPILTGLITGRNLLRYHLVTAKA